jgi:hypothetical protein
MGASGKAILKKLIYQYIGRCRAKVECGTYIAL